MILRLLIAITWMIGVTPSVHALTRAFTVEDIAARSDLVIVGKVTDYSIFKDHLKIRNDADGEVFDWVDIFTQWQIEVSCRLKGEYVDKTLTVLSPGGELETGEVSNWSMSYRLSPGDELLIFLTWDELNSVWWAKNQAAGVFKLSDVDGRKKLNAVGESDVVLIDSQADLERTRAMLNAVWLDEVKDRINDCK
jgi:hypothetical protein